jgi:hypothetical protein
MSPRSSTASTSTSIGSSVVAVSPAAGYVNATVGAVVSAPVGSRCASERRTRSLRFAVLTCSRPKPNVTVSRVEIAAPPDWVCGGSVAKSSSTRSCRSGFCTAMPDQLRRRVGDLARGSPIPLASWFGSLPEPVSSVIGPMPSNSPPVAGATGTALNVDVP